MIESLILKSEEKRRGSSTKKEAKFSEPKKEVLRFTIDENVTKKNIDNGSGYCSIF